MQSNIEHFIESLALHDLGKAQFYWTQVLTRANETKYTNQLLVQLPDILLMVEKHLELTQSEEETLNLLNIITEGYQLIQVKETPSNQTRARAKYYYYYSFLAIDAENQRIRLELAHDAFTQLEEHAFQDYRYHAWALFYLRLLTQKRKKRNNYLDLIWDFIEQMWHLNQKAEDITQYIITLDLQGWTVADTRLTLAFDEWWGHVEKLAEWLSQISVTIEQAGTNYQKAIFFHWQSISAYQRYFANMNKKGWQFARKDQVNAINYLRIAYDLIQQTNNTNWQAIILGRLISKGRPTGLGWKTYSQLIEKTSEVEKKLQATKNSYLIALGNIWISTSMYRAAWLMEDLSSQKTFLITSKDQLMSASSILIHYYGKERVVYPYRRLCFIFSFLLEREHDAARKAILATEASKYAKLSLNAAISSESEHLQIAAVSTIVNVRRLIGMFTDNPEEEIPLHEEAIKLVSNHLEIAKSTNQMNSYGYLLVDLGSLYSSFASLKNNPSILKQADECFAEAIEIFDEQKERNILGRLSAARGRILGLSGAHQHASGKYQKAYRLLKTSQPQRANYYRMWAFIERSKEAHLSKDYHKANQQLKKGFPLVLKFQEKQLEGRFWELASLIEYAEHLVSQHRFQLAIKWFQKSKKALQGYLRDLNKESRNKSGLHYINHSGFLIQFIDIRLCLVKGRLNNKKGKHRLAFNHYQKALLYLDILRKSENGRNIPDLISQLEGILRLRVYLQESYIHQDVSEIKAALLFLSSNQGIFPPNSEPKIAILKDILILISDSIEFYQELVVTPRMKQLNQFLERYEKNVESLRTLDSSQNAQHLFIISRFFEVAFRLLRSQHLKQASSKKSAMTDLVSNLIQIYREAQGIKNQTVQRRLARISRSAKGPWPEKEPFVLNFWDVIIGFPVIDILGIQPNYDFRLIHLEDPIPILEQREYSEQIKEDKVVRFHSQEAQGIFTYLTESFIEDMKNQMPSNQCGFRSLPQVISACQIPGILIYGKYPPQVADQESIKAGWPSARPKPGAALHELLDNGLIQAKELKKGKGRKGSPIKVRISVEKVPIRLYIKQKWGFDIS